jgi:hypothetical protein
MATPVPKPSQLTAEVNTMFDTQSNTQTLVPATVPSDRESGAQELLRLYSSAEYPLRQLLLQSSRG